MQVWHCNSQRRYPGWIGKRVRPAQFISRLVLMWSAIMPTIGGWPSDCANLVASQFAAKNYFHGELSGARHILGRGESLLKVTCIYEADVPGLEGLQKDSPAFSSIAELLAFKSQMAKAVHNFKTKTKMMHVPDIRRLLLRAVSVLVASPTASQISRHALQRLIM